MLKSKTTTLCSLILMVSILLAVLSGCGSGGAPVETSSVDESPAASEPVAEEVAVPDSESTADASEATVEEPSAEPSESDNNDQFHNITFEEQVDLAEHGNFIDELMNFPYAEETRLPVTTEDVTFSYFMRAMPFMMAYQGSLEYPKLTFFKEWQERTGIKLDITVASFFVVAQKFQLMVASGEYANFMDSVESYTGGASAALNDDVIYSLDDILDEYLPNYAVWLDSDDNYRRVCTSLDGQLYLLGYFEYGTLTQKQGGIINQGWLDEAGLDVPVTYDDMHDTLLEFKANGHGGALWMTSALDSISHIYNSGYEVANHANNARGSGFINKDGTVIYSFMEDGMRDYLSMLNGWYSEGLIYPDFISVDPGKDTIDSGLVTSGTIGVYSGAFDTAETLMRDSDVTLSPMGNLRKTPDQTIHLNAQSIYQQCGIALGTSIPEELLPVAAQAMDYLYSKEGVILSNFGVEGEGLEYDENGMPRCTDLIINNDELPMTVIGIVLYAKYGGAGVNFAPREYSSYDEAYWNACRVWAKNSDNAYEVPFEDIFTTEESEIFDNTMNVIKTIASEYSLQFVVGERSLDEWADFVSVLKDNGVEEAISIYQAALDRYLGVIK